MSPRKLSDDDKQKILQLYRQSDATTSTLAERYEVSSSTISRFLKNNLSKSEYEALIQQKRLAHVAKRDNPDSQSIQQKNEELSSPSNELKTAEDKELSFLSSEPKIAEDEELSSPTDESNIPDKQETSLVRRRRRRSSISSEPITSPSVPTQKPKIQAKEKETEKLPLDKEEEFLAEEPEEKEFERVEAITLKEMLGEDLLDLDEDEDEDELDEDEDEEWDAETDKDLSYPHAASSNIKIKILPLSAASFPRTCYLVVDRTAELITRPLEDFADLGTIPDSEIQQQTLPVFDNHRVARRFSHRRERVIKVPDGRMLQKTSQYLQAKGITRLLIDGQIYSL
ncbi:transposase [Pleurocapsales cyanobacterium LEGE 06147]|nr:transposase [Pleurocapsales cyanobacterium LEGE 06147]